MRFFVDESGDFAPAPGKQGSWSALACYITSESQWDASHAALNAFRETVGGNTTRELKLKHVVVMESYFQLLENLHRAGGIVSCVASDAGLYGDMEGFKRGQAELIRQGHTRYDLKASAVGNALATDLMSLSTQLFVDLMCRVEMAWRAVKLGTMHFVRREPQTLGTFRWRFDEKGRIEPAYRPLWAGMAKALSLAEPLGLVKGANYGAMDCFRKAPPAPDDPPGIWYDASSLCLDDLVFVTSHEEPGVQIADLIAAGVRRCLLGGFGANNLRAACLLGRLMRRIDREDQAIRIIAFGERAPVTVAALTERAVLEMNTWARVLG